MFRPNFVLVRKTLLSVPETGTSSHLRMYDATILSKFSDTQVLDRSATVRYHEG